MPPLRRVSPPRRRPLEDVKGGVPLGPEPRGWIRSELQPLGESSDPKRVAEVALAEPFAAPTGGHGAAPVPNPPGDQFRPGSAPVSDPEPRS